MSEINPLHVELAKLRERNDYLEAEVERLTEEMHGKSVQDQIALISAAFKVPRATASLLRVMSDGGIKSSAKLLDSYDHNDSNSEVDIRNVDVYMSRIRKQFGKSSIVTHWGFGRSMSPELCEKVKAVMAGGQQ